MPYSIELTPAAAKILLKLAKKDRALMLRLIEQFFLKLANRIHPTASILLETLPIYVDCDQVIIELICQVDGGRLVVLVVHVGHCKDVYRYLKR